MIFTPKHTNSHFFDTSLKILTPAPLVVLVTNFKYVQLLFQPTVSLPARHNMLARMQTDFNGRRIWLFYNAIGAVAQCPYNWGVGSRVAQSAACPH